MLTSAIVWSTLLSYALLSVEVTFTSGMISTNLKASMLHVNEQYHTTSSLLSKRQDLDLDCSDGTSQCGGT
jgi:hypothetical protein